MKITFLLPAAGLSGGVRVVADYADHLARQGHEVLVISNQHTARGRWERLRLKLGFRPRVVPHPPSHLPGRAFEWHLVDSVDHLPDAAIPASDIVIATFWSTAERVRSLPPDKGVQVYFCQGFEVFDHAPRERVIQTYVDMPRQVCVSEWVAARIRDVAPDSRQLVVTNGVDASGQFAIASPVPRERQVGFVWGAEPIKGADLAFEAIRTLKERDSSVHAIAFGAFATPAESMAERGITYCTRPSPGEIAGMYGSCRAWLFPSREEGFGLPILEAMACGTPVVGFDAGAADMFLPDGGGVLLKDKTAEALARAAAMVLQEDDESWRCRSLAARAMAERHDVRHAAAAFEAALRAFLDER